MDGGRYDGTRRTTSLFLDGYLSRRLAVVFIPLLSSGNSRVRPPSSYSYVMADRQRMSPIYSIDFFPLERGSGHQWGEGGGGTAKNSTFSCKRAEMRRRPENLCCSLIRRSRRRGGLGQVFLKPHLVSAGRIDCGFPLKLIFGGRAMNKISCPTSFLSFFFFTFTAGSLSCRDFRWRVCRLSFTAPSRKRGTIQFIRIYNVYINILRSKLRSHLTA